jgi:hypothetical protein
MLKKILTFLGIATRRKKTRYYKKNSSKKGLKTRRVHKMRGG